MSLRLFSRAALLAKFARRSFASEVAISTPPRLEHYNPIEMDRYEVDGSLAGKEKKPWTELSKEDKIASKFLIFYLIDLNSLSLENAKIFCLFVGEIKIVQSSYTGCLKF